MSLSIRKQLKKLEIKDKKGKVKGYLGKPKFIPNPTMPGFAGIVKNPEGDLYRIDKKSKERDINKRINQENKAKKKIKE